jgi:hypothetical protein
LSQKRDQAAAVRFLQRAITTWKRPTKLTLDRYVATHQAIQELKETQYLTRRVQVRTASCLTNRIEQDHRRIKQRVRAMQTFQVFRNAQKYRLDFPERFGGLTDTRVFSQTFFPSSNGVHHHSQIGLMTPAAGSMASPFPGAPARN